MPPSRKAWACSALLISRSTTFTPGAWRRSSRSARGSVSNSAEVTSPTVSWPAAAARDLAGALLGGVDAGHADARVLDDGQRRRRGRAQARTLEQAHAQVLSMRPNAWLSAGCAMPSHSAARLTLPWSITARK